LFVIYTLFYIFINIVAAAETLTVGMNSWYFATIFLTGFVSLFSLHLSFLLCFLGGFAPKKWPTELEKSLLSGVNVIPQL